MEKKTELNQVVENQEILVDGKKVEGATAKAGIFSKIGSAAASLGKNVWRHKELMIGAAVGVGAKILLDAVKSKTDISEEEGLEDSYNFEETEVCDE